MSGSLFAAHWQSSVVWLISILSIALVLIRPKGWPEAWWASGGAGLLIISRLVPVSAAGHAIGKGLDVYGGFKWSSQHLKFEELQWGHPNTVVVDAVFDRQLDR